MSIIFFWVAESGGSSSSKCGCGKSTLESTSMDDGGFQIYMTQKRQNSFSLPSGVIKHGLLENGPKQ